MSIFPIIDIESTGKDLQVYFGFEEPQAIYKWQWGKCLPSVDNLFALSKLFNIPIEEILVEKQSTRVSFYLLKIF